MGHGLRHLVMMPFMARVPYYDQIWQYGHGHMVIIVTNISVYGTSEKRCSNLVVCKLDLYSSNESEIAQMTYIFQISFVFTYTYGDSYLHMTLILKILFLPTFKSRGMVKSG